MSVDATTRKDSFDKVLGQQISHSDSSEMPAVDDERYRVIGAVIMPFTVRRVVMRTGGIRVDFNTLIDQIVDRRTGYGGCSQISGYVPSDITEVPERFSCPALFVPMTRSIWVVRSILRGRSVVFNVFAHSFFASGPHAPLRCPGFPASQLPGSLHKRCPIAP